MEIETVKPRWQELKHKHGIIVKESLAPDENHFLAYKDFDTPNWECEPGETEREAVVALIHRLQLDGWQSVSIRP